MGANAAPVQQAPQLYVSVGHSWKWKILMLVPGPKQEPLPKALSGQFWFGTHTYSCLRPCNECPKLQEPLSHHISLQVFVTALSHLGFSLSAIGWQENKHRNVFAAFRLFTFDNTYKREAFMTAFAHQIFIPSVDPRQGPETRRQSIISIVDHSLGGVSVEML